MGKVVLWGSANDGRLVAYETRIKLAALQSVRGISKRLISEH